MTQYEVNRMENRMVVDSEWEHLHRDDADYYDPYDPFWVPDEDFTPCDEN